MTASVGLSGAGLAKLRSAVTVVSARAGALQLTTAPAAFLHNSKLVRPMSQLGQTQTWPHLNGRSVLPSEADIVPLLPHVCFVPILLQKSVEGFREQ